MAKLNEKQLEFLENPYVGVVTSCGGRLPQSTVVWVDVEDAFRRSTRRSAARIAEEPRERSAGRAARARPERRLQVGCVDGRTELTTRAPTRRSTSSREVPRKDEYPFRNPEEQRVTVRIVRSA